MSTKKMSTVISDNLPVYEEKTKIPFGRHLILGMLAGAFIAIGASSSMAAIYNITDSGLAKVLAGAIFPVGLIFVVMIGGELFTGNCLLMFGILEKRVKKRRVTAALTGVFFANMLGALLIVILVNQCGQLDFGGGALGATVIQTAYNKLNIPFGRALCSGILCNILVCLAVLMAGTAHDVIGKIFAIFFPILAFVIGGYEHCVANMYYIPAGLLAKESEAYYQAAIDMGMTAAQIDSMSIKGYVLDNLVPVTIGNIIGGMFLVALPLYFVSKQAIKAEAKQKHFK